MIPLFCILKSKWLPEDRISESVVFFVLIHVNYPVCFVHSDSLLLFDQISLENLNNNDTGYKSI